jgi:hypothetical protein
VTNVPFNVTLVLLNQIVLNVKKTESKFQLVTVHSDISTLTLKLVHLVTVLVILVKVMLMPTVTIN